MGKQGEKSGKLYYSMGEVAEMLDVKQSLIRFWEQKFDVVKPKKNKKGNRMFTPSDVQNLKMIYHLVKERGMTLTGAQKYMKASRGEIERDMELTERLQSIRALLLEVRQQLGADGSVVTDDYDEPFPAGNAGILTAEEEKVIEEFAGMPEEETEVTVEEKAEIREIIEEAHKEEEIDAMMDNVIAELDDEPEEMLDFDPSPVFEPEPEKEAVEEQKPAELQKPVYVEQTLF